MSSKEPNRDHQEDNLLFLNAYQEAIELKRSLHKTPENIDLQDLSKRYEIKNLLGEGAIKKVYLAHDHLIERDVALAKVTSNSPEVLNDLVNEARLASQLEHPNIAPIYDVGMDESGLPFFVMKLYEGRPLNEELTHLDIHKKNKKERITWVLNIFIKVCEAVSFAHSKGILHLDIKPSNIRIDDYGEVILCDWGISNRIHDDLPEPCENHVSSEVSILSKATLMGKIRGTPGYMAPEQQDKSHACNQRTDIYGLGALLLDMITGSPDYLENSKDDFPTELIAICSKAMSKNHLDRYPNVLELIDDLQKYKSGQVTLAEDASFFESTKKWFQRNRKVVLLIISNLLLIASIFSFYLYTIQESKDQLEQALFSLNQEKLKKSEEDLKLSEKYYEQGVTAYHSAVSKFDFDSRDLSLAKEMLIRSTQLNSHNPKLWGILGNLRLINDEFQEALFDYSKAGTPYKIHHQILTRHLNLLIKDAPQYLKNKLKLIRDITSTKDMWLRNHMIFKEIHEFHDFETLLYFAIESVAICNNVEKVNYTYDPENFSLNISNNKIRTVYPLKTLPIKRLNLSHSNFSSSEVQNIRKMPLTHLDISYTSVTHLNMFGNLGIETLNLEACPIKNLSGIEKTAVQEINVIDIPATLQPLAACKYLKKVICNSHQAQTLKEILKPAIVITVK